MARSLALLLDTAALPLLVHTPPFGGTRRFRGASLGVSVERRAQACSKTLDRKVAVALLGPMIVDLDDDEVAELVDDSPALLSGAGVGVGWGPANLGPGVRSVRVLATGSAGRAEPPLELVTRHDEVVAYPNVTAHDERS